MDNKLPRREMTKLYRPKTTCIFCDIVDGKAPANILQEWEHIIAIVPLNPVVAGHTLIIPKSHVNDFTENRFQSMYAMEAAAEFARHKGPMNLITSKGVEATQSVFHLHIHLVPRKENDGLALPWYSGKTKKH